MSSFEFPIICWENTGTIEVKLLGSLVFVDIKGHFSEVGGPSCNGVVCLRNPVVKFGWERRQDTINEEIFFTLEYLVLEVSFFYTNIETINIHRTQVIITREVYFLNILINKTQQVDVVSSRSCTDFNKQTQWILFPKGAELPKEIMD